MRKSANLQYSLIVFSSLNWKKNWTIDIRQPERVYVQHMCAQDQANWPDTAVLNITLNMVTEMDNCANSPPNCNWTGVK